MFRLKKEYLLKNIDDSILDTLSNYSYDEYFHNNFYNEIYDKKYFKEISIVNNKFKITTLVKKLKNYIFKKIEKESDNNIFNKWCHEKRIECSIFKYIFKVVDDTGFKAIFIPESTIYDLINNGYFEDGIEFNEMLYVIKFSEKH